MAERADAILATLDKLIGQLDAASEQAGVKEKIDVEWHRFRIVRTREVMEQEDELRAAQLEAAHAAIASVSPVPRSPKPKPKPKPESAEELRDQVAELRRRLENAVGLCNFNYGKADEYQTERDEARALLKAIVDAPSPADHDALIAEVITAVAKWDAEEQ